MHSSLTIFVGNYKILNTYTQTALSVDPLTQNMSCAEYGAVPVASSHWRLTGLSDGLYRIESITGIPCLSSDLSSPEGVVLHPRDQGMECRWRLRPSTDASIFIENAATCLVLMLTDGSAEVGAAVRLAEAGRERDIPWQKFNLERLDDPARCFDDLGSDKVLNAYENM
jgi:hypothetical protein